MPWFLRLVMRPSWGFASRLLPQSKMRLAFKHPPPTSLIGALAYPLARELEGRREYTVSGAGRRAKYVSTADILRRGLLAVASRIRGEVVVYGSYLRINRYYRGSVEAAVTALPSAYMSVGSALEAVYVFEDGFVGKVGGDVLTRAAYGVTRVGSRESVFSVEEVYWGEAGVLGRKEFETGLSFPLPRDAVVEGEGDVVRVVDWVSTPIGDYTNAPVRTVFHPRGVVRVRTPAPVRLFRVPGVEGVVVSWR